MKDKRNFLIGGLFIAVLFMAVGFAALSQRLTINGSARISSTWDVKITSITASDVQGTAVAGSPTFTASSATFNTELKSPGDSVTYDIVVTNAGSLDAILKDFTITPSETASSGIKYTVTGVEKGSTTLPATNGTNTIKVKAEWVASDTSIPQETTKEFTATFDYQQQA